MKSLKFIFFLAWRNVLRYRRRTIQTFLILFCGTFCIMLVDAFMKGMAASSAERIVELTGHLDVHAVGYLDSAEAMPLDLAIPDADGVMREMLATAAAASTGGVYPLAAPSVETGCMLSNGERSRAAGILATDPWARTLPKSGKYVNPLLADVGAAVISGHFYERPDERGAILDEKYARKLGLTEGDDLILLGNDSYGSFSMLEIPVIAVAREASLPGEAGCVVDLASFAPVFGLENRATAISLWFASGTDATLDESEAEPEAVNAVITTLGTHPGLEVRPFAEISASYAAMFDFLDVFLGGMMAIFALVAGVGMTNAILLSVQNRIKDIGTLRAIALTSRQAGLLVYAETFITGMAAAAFSLGIGTLAIWLLCVSGAGITFNLTDMASALPTSIKPGFFPLRLLATAAISGSFPILAAILPARSARRLTIRESLGV